MRIRYTLFFLIFILLPSLSQAGGYEKTITKIGDSQVPNGKMQISSDGKFLYVCNTNGNFAKFDIEKGMVVDTMKLPAQNNEFDSGFRGHFFVVDKNNEFLIYATNIIYVYDLKSKTLDHSYKPFDYWYEVQGLSIIDSKIDSVIIVGTYEIGYEGSGQYYLGRVFGSNIWSMKETKSYNNEQAFKKILISNDGKNILTQSEYHNSWWSSGDMVSTTETSVTGLNDTLGKEFVFSNSVEQGYGDYYKHILSIGLDNTGDLAYFFRRNGVFTIYSFSQKKEIYSELRPVLYTDFTFVSNDKFYVPYIYGKNSIRLYSKKYHIRTDEIYFEKNIMNIVSSADSTSIYVLDELGEIFEIKHDLFRKGTQSLFSADKTELQFGDSITLYDNSIGTYDSRKWFINGVEQPDTSEIFRYIPVVSGLHSAELQVFTGSEMKNLVRTDFFNVYKSVKADFSYQIEEFKDSIGVNFTNLSVGDSLKFKWYFGDGATSEETNPYHYYTTQGLYSVTLITYNNRFSDTIISNETVQFGDLKAIMNITAFTNRNSGSNPLYYSGWSNRSAGVTGTYGLKLPNNGYGIDVKYQQNIDESNHYFNIDLISMSEYLLLFNTDNKLSTTTNLIYDYNFTLYPDDYADITTSSLIFNDSTILILEKADIDTDDDYEKSLNYFSYNLNNSEFTQKYYFKYNNKGRNLQSFFVKSSNNSLIVVHSYNDKSDIAFPKTDICKINLSTSQEDTTSFDMKFNHAVADHENGKIKLVSEKNQTASIYEYSQASGLQKLFDLNNMDSILFVDQNVKSRKMLFVSRNIINSETSLLLTVTDFEGNIKASKKIENTKTICDIKFADDYILIIPENYGVRLRVYDLHARLLNEYSDNLITKGYVNNITLLSENKVLLVGTKFESFSNILNRSITSQSELYYIVDLEKLDSVPNDDPGKIDVSTIRCSPNPTNGDVTFNFDNASNQIVLLKIVGPMGNELATLETSNDFASFPAAGLGSGIYFVRGIVGGKSISGKFVVAR